MSFGIYAIGFAIMIGGLIYGAHLMHMPAHWIAVGAIVLLGVGICRLRPFRHLHANAIGEAQSSSWCHYSGAAVAKLIREVTNGNRRICDDYIRRKQFGVCIRMHVEH